MNILFLCCEGSIAGSTYSISALAKGLAKRGHNVYMGCLAGTLLEQLVENDGVTVVHLPFNSKVDLKTMRLIRDTVKKYNIDVINPQSSKDRYLTAFAQWIYRFWPVVVHTRRQRVLSSGGLLQSWFYMSVTDKIVACSHGVKDQLIQKGIKRNHIQVIYNGTTPEKYNLKDPGFVDVLKQKYDIKEGDVVIGCVSREKLQEQLVRSLTLLEFPVKLMLVGSNPNEKFDAIAQNFKQNHQVICTGKVPMDEALYYYKLFMVKVLPSTSEGLSQSLLEAMASGVPVIATNAVGNPDLIKDGQNGFLFNDNDIETLANQITQLVKDPVLRQRFIEAGKKTALEDFSLEKTIGNYESFFEELVKEKKKRIAKD